MRRLNIGVLEIISRSVGENRSLRFYAHQFRRHYAAIAPQAVSVWCRRLGHRTHYRTYYGQADPLSLLPKDLDVLFISVDTRASALAYALAKIYRGRGALTVLGGPHARSFPADGLRFFDFVVEHCDEALIADLLGGHFETGSHISTGRPLTDLPTVEERLPEIKIASYAGGRRAWLSTIPILSSIGCPYTCNFCIDWNSTYTMMSPDALREDLTFIAEHLPRALVAFHDPNFGIKFDPVLQLVEESGLARTNRYIVESSLSVLKEARLKRLRDTGCVYIAPAVESWGAFSQKAGVGAETGERKLDRLVDHFERIYEYIPGVQVNFIFGTDDDQGEEPVELTQEFCRRLPFSLPAINIPTPFGGAPLYEQYLADGRILKTMPFGLYYLPFLAITLKHYEAREFYEKLVDLYGSILTSASLRARFKSVRPFGWKCFHLLRYVGYKQDHRELVEILRAFETDAAMESFHAGRSDELPTFYRMKYAEALGRYDSLLTEQDRRPTFVPAPSPIGPSVPEADQQLSELPAPGLSAGGERVGSRIGY